MTWGVLKWERRELGLPSVWVGGGILKFTFEWGLQMLDSQTPQYPYPPNSWQLCWNCSCAPFIPTPLSSQLYTSPCRRRKQQISGVPLLGGCLQCPYLEWVCLFLKCLKTTGPLWSPSHGCMSATFVLEAHGSLDPAGSSTFPRLLRLSWNLMGLPEFPAGSTWPVLFFSNIPNLPDRRDSIVNMVSHPVHARATRNGVKKLTCLHTSFPMLYTAEKDFYLWLLVGKGEICFLWIHLVPHFRLWHHAWTSLLNAKRILASLF